MILLLMWSSIFRGYYKRLLLLNNFPGDSMEDLYVNLVPLNIVTTTGRVRMVWS